VAKFQSGRVSKFGADGLGFVSMPYSRFPLYLFINCHGFKPMAIYKKDAASIGAKD
jgi:hypothetical protein